MALTDAQRESIAASARTLRERLENPPAESAAETVDAEKWLSRWLDHLADGDEELLEARLERAGYSRAECRRRLARGGWPDGTPLPEWVDRVDELLDYVETELPDEPPADPAGADDRPFAHLLVAVVEYATEQVDWSAVPDAVTEEAVDDLREHLLARLVRAARHPLFIEFKTFLADRDRELAFADDPEVPDPPARHYEAFVAEQLSGGLTDFLVEYAVLAKLVVKLVEMWVGAVEEFGAHLAADLADVTDALCEADDPGSVEEVDVYGDVHRAGRRVLGLGFESGDRVIYKPRDVEAGLGYAAVVEWLNEESSLPDLAVVERLARDDHGWVEWIETGECADREAVADYYRRAGALVCVAYALNFSDGNLENILAAGDHPVFVDLETVVQPRMVPEATTGEETVAEVFRTTVLGTELLPMHRPKRDIRRINGFGSAEAEVSEVERPEFSDVNTDAMDVEFEDTSTLESENLPRLDGDHVLPEDYADEIRDGFETAYRFVADDRETLIGEDGLVERFADAEVRHVYRPSMTYSKVLVPLETPSYLRTGLAFDTKVERLARPFFDGRTDTWMWPVFEAERESLWRYDIPRFTVGGTDTALSWGDGSVEGAFETTAVERVRERVREFGPEDLDEQLDYLRLAYEPEQFSHPDPPAGDWSTAASAEEDLEAAALRVCRQLYGRLRDHELRTPDDHPFWVVREYMVEGIYFPRVPDNFYSGRPGIATFAAALGEVLDEDRYRDYARDVVAMSYEEVEEIDLLDDMKLGLGLGYGGLVYGLVKLWELLDDDRYLDGARRAALRISKEILETDEHLDPHRGTSGLIIALVVLYEVTGDDEVRDRAVLAGDHLLEHRTGSTGLDLWRRSREGGETAPVNHGGDGLPYALFELADVTGADRFREAAAESLEYDLAHQDRPPWPDVRSQDPEDVTPGWCDGRVGLGISRLALHEATGDGALAGEAAAAADAVDADGLARWDNLYSGNAARVEFLSRAARALDEPAYRESARRLAGETVARADEVGRLSVPWQTEKWYNPGLIAGETGVGYSLLRFVEPDLPNVLFFD